MPADLPDYPTLDGYAFCAQRVLQGHIDQDLPVSVEQCQWLASLLLKGLGGGGYDKERAATP